MIRFVMSAAVCLIISGCSEGESTPQATKSRVDAPAILGSSSHAQLNAIRARANRPAVKRSAVLDAAAQAHAKDMASKGFFSHTGSNGSTVDKRVSRAGYRWCTVAENISKGYPNQAAAIESWRASPGHYRNLTKKKVKEFGIANVGDVWVMVLAAKKC